MSTNNQKNLSSIFPLYGPVDVKTFVGCATLYGCGAGNVFNLEAPTSVVSSLAGKYGMSSRFVRCGYGPVAGAMCFGGLTAAFAGVHNWRIENRYIDDNAAFNYIGLFGTAFGALLTWLSVRTLIFPGTTFRQSARSGIIGAFVGAALLIPYGITFAKSETYREVVVKHSEQGDIKHDIGAIEKELEV